MSKHEKTVKILESFLETYTMDGVCSFFVDSEEGAEREEDRIAVYMVLDLDWVNKEITKPGFVANRMRAGLKEEIKKYTGLDVYVGSTARKCEENITESVSTYLRRRLSFEHMKQDIDNLVDYELNPCEFNNIGDFVAEACNILAYNYLEELQVSSKDKDGFYIALVDLFGKHLVNVYKQRCVKGLRESKKTYIVTESQYKRLVGNFL